jgi:hypothetical protein
MGRGDSGSRGVALLRRSRGVSKQAAMCNRLVQETQTGDYGNVLGLLSSADGQDEFWNTRRLDTLRDELIYDLTARAMLTHQQDLRRMLRLIESEGLDADTARTLTGSVSGRLARHLQQGRLRDPDEAVATAHTEFIRALVRVLAEQAQESGDEAVSFFLGDDYPRFNAALHARHERRTLGSLISLDQWRALFAHLLIAAPDDARQQAHDYLRATLGGNRHYAQQHHWQPLPNAEEAPAGPG